MHESLFLKSNQDQGQVLNLFWYAFAHDTEKSPKQVAQGLVQRVQRPPRFLPTDGAMTQVLNAFWEKIYSCDACHPPEQMATLLKTKYLGTPMPSQWIPDVLAADLASAVKDMRSAASAGPGGWTIAQLKTLPIWAWHDFSSMLHLYERHGLPGPLKEIWVALLPKGDELVSPRADDVRPIAVSSSLYRLYSKAKAATMMSTIEQYLHAQQWGGRPQRSVMQGVAQVVTRVEAARLSGQPCVGLSIDIKKFFDCIPTAAVSLLLEHAGVDVGTAQIVQNLVCGMQRRWRLPGRTLSPYIQISRGVAQGCTSSVMLANILVCAAIKYTLRGREAFIQACGYVDDLIFLMSDEADLGVIWQRLCAFTAVVGLEINRKKSFIFTTCEDMRARWHRIGTIDGLTVQTVFTYIGVLVNTMSMNGAKDHPAVVEKSDELVAKTKQRLTLLRTLPMSVTQRGIIAGAAVMATLLHAPWMWTWQWSQKQWASFKQSIVAATQGAVSPKSRIAREVFLHLLHRGHRLDPFAALADVHEMARHLLGAAA